VARWMSECTIWSNEVVTLVCTRARRVQCLGRLGEKRLRGARKPGGGCPSRVQLEGLAVGGVEVPRKLAGSWKRSPASEREQQSPSRWHSDTLSRSQRSTRSSDGMLEGRPCRDLALQDLAREVRSLLELHPQQRRPLAPLALRLLPLLR
jgi:hypothetical protein